MLIYTLCQNLQYFNDNSITEDNAFMWFFTGIPGIVFRFLHLFYCIVCGLQGVPVVNNYPVWSYIMIIDWYHHLLTGQHTFTLISTYFYWFCDMWYPPVKWLVWFSQSWLWHWCMPLLHLEWYYATNDSDAYFYFCSSVEASCPLKVLSFMNLLWTLMSFCDIYWTLWNHVMHVGLSWMTIKLQWRIVH